MASRAREADLLAEPETPPEADDEAPAPEKGPLRRCLVSRESLPKQAMLRFVVGPDGTLVPDMAARLPGRGFWLSARADVLEAARKRGAFVRAARAAGIAGPVIVPADLAARTTAALLARIAETLGLARRAGQAVSGHDRAAEWVAAGRAGLLVQAADGAPAGRAKLARQAARAAAVAPLPAAVLGRMFGRDHAVHVVVAPGRLADQIAMDCARLAGIRPGAACVEREAAPDAGAAEGGTGTDTE